MTQSTIQRAFSAGELAPAFHARADSDHYVSGLRTCRNFQVMKSGGAQNRAGFRYIGTLKTNSSNSKLLCYRSETAGQSILIEAGAGYLRFYKNGAQINVAGVSAYNGATVYEIGDLVSSGGVNYYCIKHVTGVAPPNATYWYAMPGTIYEVPTPFSGSGLFKWHQSGNVITMTHHDDPPYELIHFADTQWVMQQVVTVPAILPPNNVNVTVGVAGTRTVAYIVTAALEETYEESEPGTVASISGAGEPTADNPDEITWDPVTDAAEYYVYYDPNGNGTFGFVGTATGQTTFKNTGFLPDFNVTPPQPRPLFDSADNYPDTSATYQQRRFFANTENSPEAVWGSRTGFRSNFGISSPLQDDDAITFRLAGNQNNPVRHLVGLKTLIVMTDGGEWTVGVPKQALTPSDLPADTETYSGSNDVRPCVIDNSLIFVQSRGALVKELRFDINVSGFTGKDLTAFATHLFNGKQITDLDYAQSPDSTLWCVRNDGTLLGLTYLRDQDTFGWHRHDTGASGRFERVCVVPEDGRDVVYVIVRRTIGGNTVRYVEMLEARDIDDYDTDAFFVDSGLSYSGAAATSFSGLNHLEGQQVIALADGVVRGPFTVTGGAVTLPAAASNVHIGLAVTAQLETLDLDVSGVMIRDKEKLITSATVLVDKTTIGFELGPQSDRLETSRLAPWETSVDEYTGQVETPIDATFEKPGRIFIQQTNPVPITVLAVMPNLTLGG